jgi:hypothetical protein
MYDSDELRALAVAAQAGSPIAQYRLNDTLEPETVLELLDEIERLRKDAERLDWLTRQIAGSTFRKLGIEYGDFSQLRSAIDAARTQGE